MFFFELFIRFIINIYSNETIVFNQQRMMNIFREQLNFIIRNLRFNQLKHLMQLMSEQKVNNNNHNNDLK